MGRWGSVALGATLVAGMFAVSTVHAGSAEDPEVTDPSGDGGQLARDLIKAWVTDPDPGNLTFSVEFTGAPTFYPTTAFALSERITFWSKPTAGTPAGKPVLYVTTSPTQSTGAFTLGNSRFGFTATAGTFGNLNDEVAIGGSVAGKVITLKLPLTRLPGFVHGVDGLKDPYANWVLVSKGPLGGAGNPDTNVIVTTYDRAPNTGFGRNFFTLAPGPTFALNLSTPSLEFPQGGQATAQVEVVNAGAAGADLNLTANATEGYDVVIEPASVSVGGGANVTVNVTVSSSLGAGNTTNVTIAATDASGASVSVTLAVVVGPPIPSAVPDDPGANATANATTESASPAAADEGGIPGFEATLVVAAVGMLALRRRRDP
ncbi:MAG: hypothetical protein HYT80_09185 [Euryarchaeota archaeon]|nr:hypothetical protein [Euryarchaeota archaeon]